MDFEFVGMIIQMLFALGTILLLILLTYKVTAKKVNGINGQKYINVLERVQISKDVYLCIVKIGNKGQVISISAGNTTIMQQLSESEIREIEEKKKQDLKNAQLAYDNASKKVLSIINKMKSKFILKEDTNE